MDPTAIETFFTLCAVVVDVITVSAALLLVAVLTARLRMSSGNRRSTPSSPRLTKTSRLSSTGVTSAPSNALAPRLVHPNSPEWIPWSPRKSK